MLRSVGVIPARGGSKGIRHKNTRYLAGKPLIAYTIEAALRSKTLRRVIVSTDDTEIAEVAKSYGAEVPFLRPAELAKDDTPSLLVVQHAVKYIEKDERRKLDVVVLLQPTSPLRNHEYIDDAVKKLLETGADSVITVCKVRHHPFSCFTFEGDRLFPFSRKGISVSRRQDLPEVYAENGAVYAVRRNVLLEQNSVYGKDTRAVVMPYEQSIDIDDYFDFFVAEMMLRHWKGWINEKSKDWK
jgi:N-acylneuraminate cytidylyltransferase/CMP-N,N'-diacetyllegionaminic acid synthase